MSLLGPLRAERHTPDGRGAARILVTFKVDADGLLEVSAREEITGTEAALVVKPSFGLSDDEVAAMLRASQTNAAEDMQARQLREAKVEAESLLHGLAGALDADGDLLSDEERADLEKEAGALVTALQSTIPILSVRSLTS